MQCENLLEGLCDDGTSIAHVLLRSQRWPCYASAYSVGSFAIAEGRAWARHWQSMT